MKGTIGRGALAGLAIAIGLCALAAPVLDAAAAACGGEGQRACTIAAATLVGKKPARCPSGAFFDPIDGGTCWICPNRSKRTVFHVKSADACEFPAHEQFSGAARHGRGTGLLRTDCPRGQFWDPNGYCWSCPSGYGRTAHPVTHGRACARRVGVQRLRAQFAGSLACPQGSFFDLIDGGTCWQCPKGYSRTASHVKARDACAAALLGGLGTQFGACNPGNVNIGGVCSRAGNCGASGQRPCLIGERIPSCSPNLKENFKRNVCEPLKPGETPFLAGVASLSEFYGDTLRALCRQTLGGINVPSDTQLAIGANCSKNVLAGAACEWMVDQAGGNVASGVNTVLSTGPMAAQFKQEVDRAFVTRPCVGFTEKVMPAKRFGRGTGALGTDCPRGQFWDPNGYCYTCPNGTTRTLNPVDSPAACVDKFGGELARSACSALRGIDRTAGQGARCAVEVMQSGVFLSQPLDFQSASREYCMATGEFAYAVVDLVAAAQKSPKKKEEQLNGALQKLIAAIKKDTAQARKYGGLALKTGGVAAEGRNVADRLNDLRECRR